MVYVYIVTYVHDVYVYIITYVQDQWHEYIKGIEALHITMVNFTVSRSGISVYICNYLCAGRVAWIHSKEIEALHIKMTNFTVSRSGIGVYN